MKKVLIITGMLMVLLLAAMDGKAGELCDSGNGGLRSYTKKARAFLDAGQPDKALEIAKEAVELFPDSPISHYYVAFSSDRLGNSDDAIEAYEKSLALHNENFYALNNVGLLYLRKGDFESAREKLEEAVEMDNPEGYAYNNLGVAYEKLGMFDDAADAYSKAVEIDPDHEKAKMSLARVTGKTDDTCKTDKVAVNDTAGE